MIPTDALIPSGWSTPGDGGLHLKSTFEVDRQGRATKITHPNGRVDYIVYLGATEVRIYPAWNSSTNLPTGPITVVRENRSAGYTETLTMSATPTVSSGRPTGQEAIGNIETLSREHFNAAWQMTHRDDYFSLSGLRYAAKSPLGTEGTHFYRTRFAYDKLGLMSKTISPAGTIARVVHDFLGRPVSGWIGTDDTPTSGSWSPSNQTGTNLVQTSGYEYDNGGIGNSLLTTQSEVLGSPYAHRETDYAYDWRGRPVAAKAGAEASESTSFNRPIWYVEYDNLGNAVATEMFDGDTLSITTDSNTDGVPDRPTASALRAKSTTDFDELNRPYQSNTFSVNPSSGTVSSNSLVSKAWYNSRGLVMKSSSPGGTVVKNEYNGVGWNTKSYVTDGGGDSGYSDADDVTSDNVLSQSEFTYDSNGNITLIVGRERFHDETGTREPARWACPAPA